MIEYLEPVSMKFILVTAMLAVIVAITDIVLLMRHKGTARLERLIPAIDSILVIAGFMVFTGTGIVLIQSAGKIAGSKILMEPAFSEHVQKWFYTLSGQGYVFTLKVMISVFSTTIIAWFLFFIFFEVWYFLRFMIRRYMKKITS